MFAKYRLNRPSPPNGGHAFVSPIPAAIEQLRTRSPDQWRLIVTENEKLLGPSDSQHQQIRDFGAGAFSVGATKGSGAIGCSPGSGWR